MASIRRGGWDGGTRTHYIGVKVRCVTITLHPIVMKNRGRCSQPRLIVKWGGIWGSNPRHPEPQSGALPTELIPPNRPDKLRIDPLPRTRESLLPSLPVLSKSKRSLCFRYFLVSLPGAYHKPKAEALRGFSICWGIYIKHIGTLVPMAVD